jgi:mono/diheme cytochrome c family protein
MNREPKSFGVKSFVRANGRVRWLVGIKLVIASLVGSCSGEDKQDLNRRQGATIGSASLEGKNFADAEFKCLTLNGEEVETDLSLVQTPAVSYQADIEPLFAKKCANCHPAVSPPDLKSYDTVKKAAKASYDTMVDGSMPPGKPMPEAEIKLFKTWMDTGMTEKAASPPPAPAPAPASKTAPKPKTKPIKPAVNASCAAPSGLEKEATVPEVPSPGTGPKTPPVETAKPDPKAAVYLGGIEILLKAKCATCHAAGATPPDLSTYQAAKAGGPSSKATIDDGSMPPPATKITLTAEEKALFAEWASKGYPEK